MVRVTVVLLLLVALAAPASWAGAARPVSGDLAFHAPVALEGTLDVRAERGALDLTDAARGGHAFGVGWTRAQGRFAPTNWTLAGEVVYEDPHSQPVPLAFGAGRLSVLACGPKCAVLLVASGSGAVAASGEARGEMAWRANATQLCMNYCDKRVPSHFEHDSPRGALLVSSGAPRVEGRVVLAAFDAVVQVVDARGARTLDARSGSDVSLGGVAGRAHSAIVVLDLDDAALDAPSDLPFLLMGEAPEARIEGRFSSASASGAFDDGGHRAALDHDAVQVEGTLRLRFGPPETVALDALQPPYEPRAAFEGDATDVVLGAARVAPTSARDAAAGAGLASLLVLLLLLRAFPALPFYSRVGPDRVLNNANRKRILTLLRERPGLTIRELGEGAGLARIVVRHHLAMLAAHGLVRTTKLRGARRHYATDAPLDESALGASLVLRHATRRRLASALADLDGATQADLVAATGLSQRLVSYHLSHLGRSRLVDAEPGVPQRYRATPLLRELLRGLGSN